VNKQWKKKGFQVMVPIGSFAGYIKAKVYFTIGENHHIACIYLKKKFCVEKKMYKFYFLLFISSRMAMARM